MRSGPWLALALAAALAALAAAALTQGGGFDSAAWKAQHGSSARDNPRSSMVGDAMERLRPGMTRAEVVALLGPADIVEGRIETYSLGVGAYGVDYEYLVLEFDAADRLRSHRLVRG